MTQQYEPVQAQAVGELLQIGYVGLRVVLAFRIPVAVTSPTSVRGQDAVAVAEPLRQRLERPGVAAQSVQHDDRGPVLVAPLDIVRAQAAQRDEAVLPHCGGVGGHLSAARPGPAPRRR